MLILVKLFFKRLLRGAIAAMEEAKASVYFLFNLECLPPARYKECVLLQYKSIPVKIC